MRPYRAKRKDNKEWVYGWYCKVENEHFIIPSYARAFQEEGDDSSQCVIVLHSLVEVDPATVSQSTGLCDKHGKEDYVGDIWEVEYYGNGKKYRYLREENLEWTGYCFDFKCLNGDKSPVHVNVDKDGVIIGNIHEEKQ